MKPTIKFDKPGKSPFMDMQLVPVYADDGADSDAGPSSVQVSAAERQRLGIRLGQVERAAYVAAIRAVGIVAYDDSAQSVVQPRVDGYVMRLRVRTTFERVRQGQVLAEVDVPAWRAALGELLALSAATPSAERATDPGTSAAGGTSQEMPGSRELRAALRQRLAVLGLPIAIVQRVEQSGSIPDHFELTAPVDGVVTELGLREGAAFMAGSVLVRINRMGTLWVDAQLPENQSRAVAPGERVRINASAFPGQVFTGRVLRVLPQLDPVTRTVGVRVSVDNVGGHLSPGMYVEAELPGSAVGEELWVPSEAVITTGERSVVIVARAGGGFEVAEITAGVEAGGKTAILSGLAAGQSIVLSGQFLIDSEANLKSAINRLTSAEAAP